VVHEQGAAVCTCGKELAGIEETLRVVVEKSRLVAEAASGLIAVDHRTPENPCENPSFAGQDCEHSTLVTNRVHRASLFSGNFLCMHSIRPEHNEEFKSSLAAPALRTF